MAVPECVVIDFETWPIQNRPHYPPESVGLAVGMPGQGPFYMAFGHPSGNNCTRDDAAAVLREIWSGDRPILMHNAKFDLAVAEEGFGLPPLPWQRVHDTMFLAFLQNPHAASLGLKELAAEALAWPPDERDAVADWAWEHKAYLIQTYGGKVSKGKGGAWIFAVPPEIVAPYACGDIARTRALFNMLWPAIQSKGMGAAYDRERRFLPVLMANEREGIRCDVSALGRDIERHMGFFAKAEDWLRMRLKASGLNFDADRDVAAVLAAQGIVPEEKWTRTASGQLSTSKDNLLPSHFTDPQVASALGYRNRLKTCLEMFMRPWLAQAEQRNGVISTNWNQVRSPGGGTRTGRPSTNNPNFLNLSKDFGGRTDGYEHPAFLGVSPLPLVRRYLLPDEGNVWLHRDFSGQELRVFAHGEQGALWQAYRDDPDLDPHKWVSDALKALTGQEFERTKIKILNFQALYGGGAPAAQRKLGCSYEEAREYKRFHAAALPGIRMFNDEIQRIVNRGEPIRTWGGRLYYPESSDKIYKLINYWVQGSAADLTKQAIIDWHESALRSARFLVTVYDEINVSALPESADWEMTLLRDEMEKDRLSVPLKTEGKRGPSWGELTKCP